MMMDDGVLVICGGTKNFEPEGGEPQYLFIRASLVRSASSSLGGGRGGGGVLAKIGEGTHESIITRNNKVLGSALAF